jgi:hypothetical protein
MNQLNLELIKKEKPSCSSEAVLVRMKALFVQAKLC